MTRGMTVETAVVPGPTGTSHRPHCSSNNVVIFLSLVCVSQLLKSRLFLQLTFHRVATGWRIGGSFHQPDSHCCLINNLRNHTKRLLQKCAIKMVMQKTFHHMFTVQLPGLSRESHNCFFLIHVWTPRVYNSCLIFTCRENLGFETVSDRPIFLCSFLRPLYPSIECTRLKKHR